MPPPGGPPGAPGPPGGGPYGPGGGGSGPCVLDEPGGAHGLPEPVGAYGLGGRGCCPTEPPPAGGPEGGTAAQSGEPSPEDWLELSAGKLLPSPAEPGVSVISSRPFHAARSTAAHNLVERIQPGGHPCHAPVESLSNAVRSTA